MELNDAIAARRSIRAFRPEPVAPGALEAILAVGRPAERPAPTPRRALDDLVRRETY
jgi:nitroreductase